MSGTAPGKVLITGGKQIGGVTSYAEALRLGFTELGVPVEVAPGGDILRRFSELRDPGVLKILSLWAYFAAPVTRRGLFIAHGFPCVGSQGWRKGLVLLAATWLANHSRGVQVVEVSEYSALHAHTLLGVRVDAVIHNPMHPVFLEPAPEAEPKREAIIYVGNLNRVKNVDRLLPAIHDVLDENPDLSAWIIGDGPLRPELEHIAAGDKRIEFLGPLAPTQVRDRLRRSRVFVSACLTEAFGIAYLEAISQGCAVAMPASGGGLEIAPELMGNSIQLFPISMPREGVASALRRALLAPPRVTALEAYSPLSVAKAYLAADARFNSRGIFHAEAGG